MTSHARELLKNGGQEEAVSVNQRALVEKILARYSGEYTVYRELLQNADDACASTVEIHFRTLNDSDEIIYSSDTLPNLKTEPITTVMVRNDGFAFRNEDWDRLKKIAEGNPDETKIGNFGVGFYSAFSLGDDPVVSSGSKVMGFYWKVDQIYVKTVVDVKGSENVSSEGKPWTTFEIKLRDITAPMPEPNDFARFLTTCLGFTNNLKNLSLHFDGHVLCTISKTLAPPRSISLRPNLPTTTPLKILKLTSIDEMPLQIRSKMSRWMLLSAIKPKLTVTSLLPTTSSFASRMLAAFTTKTPSPSTTPLNPSTPPLTPSLDLLSYVTATLFLRIVSGHIKVSPPHSFNQEMIRSTKKTLPSTTKYSLIYSGKEEYDAGADGHEDARKVFSGLMSNLETNGRVFIGFPTFQTTGNAASVAARFVSTVERESIDFQEPTVNKWNRELLYIGGVLSRTIYEEEMSEIGRIWKQNPTISPELAVQLEGKALHLMKFFTYSPSTPSPVVSSEQETAFYISTKSSMTLLSQIGPLPANQVRISNPQLASFTHSIPTFSPILTEGAPKMINQLRLKNLVREITLDDILIDLGSHPLTIIKAIECFKWFSDLTNNKSYDSRVLGKLKDAAMLIVEDPLIKGEVSIFPLGSFKTYLNPKSGISIDEPLPSHTLPFSLSKSFNGEILSRKLGFEELSLLEWTRYLVSPTMIGGDSKVSTNLLKSPEFAEKVLNIIAKSFANLPLTSQTELIALLKPLAFIPTSLGAQLSTTSYFSNVNLFDDLPIVTLPSKSSIKPTLDKFLSDLGVRHHVELQLVFTRLLGQDGKWNHVDLTKYLISVRNSLSVAEVDRLRKTAWLPKEGEARLLNESTTSSTTNTDGSIKKAKVIRYSAGSLFEPTDIFRSLGLPLLDWTSSTSKWRSGSEEAKFLFELGLLKKPTVTQILQIAADPSNSTKQEIALNYFLNVFSNDSFGATYSPVTHDFPFVPAMKNHVYVYAKPTEVYTNSLAAILGFAVLSPRMNEHGQRLRLMIDPSSTALVSALLADPPKTTAKARTVFAYLSTQVSKFSPTDIATLGTSRIIPFEQPNGISEMLLPDACYFNTNSSLPKGLRTLFPTIPDFSSAAKQFLTVIGVRDSPSPVEIANRLTANPEKFLELSNSAESYMDILRVLAVNYGALPVFIRSKLKASAFFLGTRRIASTVEEDEDEDDEGSGGSFTYALAKPVDIVINDSPQVFRSFEQDVLCSPQDDILEKFALDLGAKCISTLVRSDYRQLGEPDGKSAVATKLSKNIKERTYLFIAERLQAHSNKSEITHSLDWIRSHLQVYEVRSIELSLSMTISGKLKRYSQPVSAYAKLVGGSIHLFIAGGVLDYFEIGSSLVPLLINKQRSGDTLLFSVILSTSLNELKRRGINVDRILNSRKQQQIQAEQRLKEEQEKNKLKFTSDSQLEDQVRNLAELFPDADKSYLRQILQSQPPPQLENAVNVIMNSNYPKTTRQPSSSINNNNNNNLQPTNSNDSSSINNDKEKSGLLSRFKKLRSGSTDSINPPPKSSSSTALSNSSQKSLDLLPPPPSTSAVSKNPLSRPPTNVAGATNESTEGLRRNLNKAIKDARPENTNSITSNATKSIVKESESYCDANAGANLNFISEIAGLRFFIDKSIPNVPQFMNENQASIARFTTLIVQPIGTVFGINPKSLHIFHDLAPSPLIAFNRSGSIFINHRFYLSWHDELVKKGELNEAMISVFHTLAHELAHNLVGPHNAEHSYYFSSLCETYFMRMSQLLALNDR